MVKRQDPDQTLRSPQVFVSTRNSKENTGGIEIESASPPYHLLLQYYLECLRDGVQCRKLSSCFKASSPNMQQWSTLALVPETCEVVDPLTDKSSNPEHSSYTASTSVHCTSTQPFTEMLQVPSPHTGHSSDTALTQL